MALYYNVIANAVAAKRRQAHILTQPFTVRGIQLQQGVTLVDPSGNIPLNEIAAACKKQSAENGFTLSLGSSKKAPTDIFPGVRPKIQQQLLCEKLRK
jgi:hypothetical protein